MNPTTTSIEIKKKASIKLYKSPRLVQKNKSTEQTRIKQGNQKTKKHQNFKLMIVIRKQTQSHPII